MPTAAPWGRLRKSWSRGPITIDDVDYWLTEDGLFMPPDDACT